MRILTISDIHIDFDENRKWVLNISKQEYQDDILILAGDVSDIVSHLADAFTFLMKRFREVLFVPGNHDLWVHRNKEIRSLEKLELIKKMAGDAGVRMTPYHENSFSIIPLHAWYDYSFGEPSEKLLMIWGDFNACQWPDTYDEQKITSHFLSMNEYSTGNNSGIIITFSHFMPRIDLMPDFIPREHRILYPALGTKKLEFLLRRISPRMHIYGHTHVNRYVERDRILYINNALGYPREVGIARRELLCVHEE
jgi:predicted phosphodiesterase